MYQIQQITADPVQTSTLVLPDGSTITFAIRFRSMQFGWFIDELSQNNFKVQGLRISVSPNILRQFKGSINFGLAVFTTLSREPTQAEDFSSGNFKLYILTAAEVEEYENFLTNGQ